MLKSATSGIAKMIVQYDWILEDVEKEPMTIASKMIRFRGEKVFRVGLKNHVTSPVLFFMAIDVKKIGMRVKDVKYGIQDRGISPATMSQMEQKNMDGDDEIVQLFTFELAKQVTGTSTFVFRICIEGSVPGYSYQLSDRLAKDQLWDAVIKNKNLADVEFVMKDKTFSAHKAILAARSPVFANEFAKEQPLTNGPQQLRIDDMEPSTVEHFLHFIYTGESMGPLANQELLELADQCKLKTLSSLCKWALEKIKPMQMVKLAKSLKNKEAETPSFIIRPEKDTEIFFDRTTPTFRCDFLFSREKNFPLSVMKYQNEDIFFADYSGRKLLEFISIRETKSKCCVYQPFLYTGVLKSSANNKQLLKLATTYEVATLKSMCQLANGAPLDVEDLTNCLLQL